jgi:hypothetical protein
VHKSVQVDGSSEQKIVLKTGATLTIPAKAVDHQVTIAMERPSDKDALQLVKSVKSVSAIASAPYVLTPHGTTFKQPVTIELPVSKDTQKRLVVAWLEDEDDHEWKKLGTPVVKGGVATLELAHFSVVMLMEEGKSGFSADDASDAGADAGATSTGDAGSADASAPKRDAATPVSEPDADGTAAETDAGTFEDEAGVFMGRDAAVASDDAAVARDASGPLDTGVAADASATGAGDAGTATPDASVKGDAASAPVDAASAPVDAQMADASAN